MKKSFNVYFKKVITLMLLFLLVLSSRSNAASLPETLHEFKNTQELSSGVKHEHIKRLTTRGWLNINVLRIDMQNEFTELRGLFNQNALHERDTVSKMVKDHGALAGVNGDYFNYSPMPSSMGGLITNNEVISSPIELAYALPSFVIDNNKIASLKYLNRHIIVKNLDKDLVIHANTLNKVADKMTSPTVLNRRWGSMSVGNKFFKDQVELVVEENMVVDIREGLEPVTIPEAGYVVSVRGDRAEILKQFEIGDNVDLFINTTPDLDEIKFAIGGGSIILQDGVAKITNIHSKGEHPRTGIGVNKDNTELIILTLDGRQTKAKGLSQLEFGELMKSFGAFNALNLDGGGSTTMAIKNKNKNESKVVNMPSGGSERKVINGVGVFSNAPRGEVDFLEIECSEPTMFKNTTRAMKVRAYDAYRDLVNIDSNYLDINIDGIEATFDGNTFIPKTSGEATITAKYLDKTTTFTIKVLDDIKDIYSDTSEIKINPNSEIRIPNIYGQDSNGSSARLYLSNVDVFVPEDIGYIKDGVIYVNDNPKTGYLTYKYDDKVENIKLISQVENAEASSYIPEQDTKLFDEFKANDDEKYGFKISIASDTLNLDEDRMNIFKEEINKSDVFISLNGFLNNFKEGITTENKISAGAHYTSQNVNGPFIATLDTRKGTIQASNSYQWIHFRDSILNRKEDNIILTSQRSLWGDFSLNDKDESEIVHKMLSDLSKNGKNVFFVSGGFKNSDMIKDGVRYITLDLRAEKDDEAKNNISILNFYLYDNNIRYSIDKVF